MDIFFGENEDNYLLWAIGRFALGAYTDSDVAKARRKPSVKGYLVMDEVTGHGNKVLILGFNPKQHRFAVILRHLNDVRIGTLDPEFTTKYVDLAFARFALGAYEFVDEFQEAVLLKESERAADFVKTPSSLQVKLPTQKDFD
ncbi:MAG: hypothetical protein JOZ77_01770 [Candidatus Eremiobacteraeota bacterium]|nr:hypothetical protein [Candidatus Eremiobacteraeota bacterium]